jgi:two-component system sensor histidine kinase SenX3
VTARVVLAVAPAATVGACVVVAAVAALVGAVLARRSAERRNRASLADAAARLGLQDDLAIRGDSPEAMVAVLERGVEDARRRTSEAVRASGTLQEALDQLPQAVLIVDDSGTIVARNEAASAFVSARHGDALVEAAVGELMDAALAGESASRTIDLFGPPRRVVVVSTAPLADGGTPTALAVVEDVTERRRLEAVRTDFVANISHELKTPVGAIGLLAETLMAEDDPEITARLATRIQLEALRVGRTIEDLLELSRIELGHVSVLEPVAVDEIVHEALARIRPAAEQAGIVVSAPTVPGGLVVAGERRQLISALSNLLDNAVKYSDPGDSIDVSAEVEGDGVAIAVADHGIGIPARDIERVFERFYRVDQARSRQTGGTGLGLAIVRHVAVNHHGSVEVDSRLGEGSCFTLRLPSAEAPLAVADAPLTDQPTTTREALRQ